MAEAAYELSLNAIREQENRLADLRGRSGTLLAAASVAASFLGGQSIQAGALHAAGATAVLAYAACVGACIRVLLPDRLGLSFRGSILLREARDAELDYALEAGLRWIESSLDANRSELAALTRWYTAACLALGGEIVLWLLATPDILG